MGAYWGEEALGNLAIYGGVPQSYTLLRPNGTIRIMHGVNFKSDRRKTLRVAHLPGDSHRIAYPLPGPWLPLGATTFALPRAAASASRLTLETGAMKLGRVA